MSRTLPPANRASRGQAFHRLFVVVGLALALSLVMSAGVEAASATVVYKGPSGSKQIALTFDDNGDSAHSVATLRALQANKVPASLFLIGSAVASTPNINTEIIKGMNAGLFEVGDHSWSHKVLTGLSTAALATEIGGGTDAFHTTTGARTVPLFRPPYGSTNARVAAAAGAEGFSYLVLWDVDPKDWAGGSASSIANHVISHAHSGAIVVMHMSAAHTAAAIPLIVKALRAKGYEFAKVSTMLKGDRLFLDVGEGSEQGAAIARMVQLGFMNGYDGNYFGPTDTITRAQVAKVATEVSGIHTDEVENVDAPLFADVPAVHNSKGVYASYPFDYVQEAATAGLVLGSVDAEGLSVFKPTADIKRLQLASILARMVRQMKGYDNPTVQPDSSSTTTSTAGESAAGATSTTGAVPGAGATASSFLDVPEYAAADVALVVSLGLMSGYSAQEFGSWSGARRGQVALAMSRYLDLESRLPAD
jgi:peptidoglycan-N-acetylglucosamine deacetylase